MEKKDDTPMWVFLAFSSINTKKGALSLIAACIVFTLYCIPWVQFFPDQSLVQTLFLIEDWEWVAMMVPMTLWYCLSLRWMDNHQAWPDKSDDTDQ